MIRSANPALNNQVFKGLSLSKTSEVMTLQGTVNKIFILLILLSLSSSYTWNLYYSNFKYMSFLMFGSSVLSLLLAMITIFKKHLAYISSPLYALAKGVFLGSVSSYFESMYPGIVIQAVGLTFATCFSLLLAYKSGLIRATENFKLGVAAATGGIFLIYFLSFIASFFVSTNFAIFSSGPIGILFSLFVVVVASLNLVMDFDFIESACKRKVPAYMEWYAAFGLMVTLAWLYIEILHLLAKTQKRN